jgi:hypothetical protein
MKVFVLLNRGDGNGIDCVSKLCGLCRGLDDSSAAFQLHDDIHKTLSCEIRHIEA